MSKLLKFIVNLFLVCAILIAAAIIIPPLAGIGTTIVDSQLMDTNLPMGSVTYSRDVYVTELEEGDRILEQDDLSNYEYIIESADLSTGTFTVRDAADLSAEPKKVQIINSEAKVILTVPYIGYVVYAMHSIEGIIILALAVLLMIILFILSELWRKDDDDDDDYYEEDEQDVLIPETEALDLQNAVDITPYMNAEGGELTDDRVIPTGDFENERVLAEEAEAEQRAAGQDLPEQEKQIFPEQEYEEIPAADIPDANEIFAAPAEDTEENEPAAAENVIPDAVPEEILPVQEELPEEENLQKSVSESAEPAEEAEEELPEPEVERQEIDMDLLQRELEAAVSTGLSEEDTEEAPAEAEPEVSTGAEEVVVEDEPSAASVQEKLLQEIRNPFGTEEPAEAYQEPAPVPEAETVKADHDAELEKAAETITEAADDVPEQMISDEEAFLTAADPDDMPDPEAESFVPAPRPELEEILTAASRSGKEPVVTEDPVTGIRIVDLSEIL